MVTVTPILNVALSTPAAALGAATGQQLGPPGVWHWGRMADAYVVVFAALMLPTGLPGDRSGRRVAAYIGAERAGSAAVAASANSAYVHGMGVVLRVCGVAALGSALPAAASLPGTPRCA
ncbi:hypothetical protein ACFY5C_34960 [Streptomyces sp. NPDC012935]|uniref:hypothetical protein n=1 Tax=Streptomyces sp. NPDC012935 TaxID=3364857 RepID=UPI0036C1AD5B